MTDETRISQELTRRAHDLHTDPITIDDIRGRATRIRRRRAAGAAACVAVIATIVIPVSLLSSTSGDRSEPDPAPPSPTHAVDPVDRGLPTLQPDNVIIYPDGPRIPLRLEEGQTPDGFAILGTDRHVVTVQTGDGGRAVVVVDESGSPTATYPLTGGLAAGTGSTAVAWMGPDSIPMLLTDDAAEPRELTAVFGGDPTAVALTGDCADVCSVWVKASGDGGSVGTSWQVDTLGNVTEAPVPAVVDVSPAGGQIAGLDSYATDDLHVCGGVYDVGLSDFSWHNCEDNVYDFSPAGELVATTFGEGLGPTGVALRDVRSGTTVNAMADVGWVPSFAWEGETLLVVVVAEGGSTSLQRLGTDGEPEVVLEGYTTSMDELRPALILPTVA